MRQHVINLAATCAFICSAWVNAADLVVFSYDRPMQLYAFLESSYMYLTGVDQTVVIYRASSDRYEASYACVKKAFPKATFVRQSAQPGSDFKQLTLAATYTTRSEYVLFAVDDIIVKDFADLSYCEQLLKKTGAYGFYLRLGQHLNYCYSQNKAEKIPALTHVDADVYSWCFNQGECEWRYPHTVDMTIFRKKEIEPALCGLAYTNPNTFEGNWAGIAGSIMQRRGLCFAKTKMVNLPLNRVQTVYSNRHMDAFSAQELLELFEQGYKIDIHDLYKIDNKSPHMEYTPRFVARSERSQNSNGMHFVVVVASHNNEQWVRNNLDSVFGQDYPNFSVIYIDDASTDNTRALLDQYLDEHKLHEKITVMRNAQRLGALENQFRAIYSCNDNDVIVIVDGDDALADTQVLSYLQGVYQDPAVWMTYGQFVEFPSGRHGFCHPFPREVIMHNTFRQYPDIPSHLRTFYAGLFKQIQKNDLMHEGEFMPMTGDMATMLPMIEMARMGHFRCISRVLYSYNEANPISDHRKSKELQRTLDLTIRSKKPYDAVATYLMS